MKRRSRRRMKRKKRSCYWRLRPHNKDRIILKNFKFVTQSPVTSFIKYIPKSKYILLLEFVIVQIF
jgi:hypothetical protein